MDIAFLKSKWEDMDFAVKVYIEEIGHVNDGFWDDGVYTAAAYKMESAGEPVGFFAIGEWDGAPMLRVFYMARKYRYLAQSTFQRVLDEHGVKRAMVPSNDAFMVALCFEKLHATGGSYDIQAYNLIFGVPRRPAEFGKECFQKVAPDEYPQMHIETENEWSGDVIPEGAEFYRVVKDGKTMGYGSVYPRKLDSGCVDIGNFTLPEHRRKGVGRSIIINLAYAAIAAGKKPIVGCWYYNHNSIKTLTSAGFVPDNRLFNISFYA